MNKKYCDLCGHTEHNDRVCQCVINDTGDVCCCDFWTRQADDRDPLDEGDNLGESPDY